MLGLTLECARCHDHKFDADHAARLLLAVRVLQQHRRVRPVLALHQCDADAVAAALAGATSRQRTAACSARIAATEARLRHAGAGGASRRSAPGARPRRDHAARADRAPGVRHRGGRHDAGRDRAGRATLQDGAGARRRSPAASGGRRSRFSGDNAVVHPGVRTFSRTDPFSLALRLKPTERRTRAVVLHQSRAWSDAGSRGFELTLDDGRPFFGLIHFWPGNAIAVRAREPLPLGRLVVASSSPTTDRAAPRASRIYVDGAPARRRRRARSARTRTSPTTRPPATTATEPHAAHARRALPRQRLQERADRRSARLRRRARRAAEVAVARCRAMHAGRQRRASTHFLARVHRAVASRARAELQRLRVERERADRGQCRRSW